ncbi:MAG: hypothetical protein WAK33_06180, partial [Silvibacterium sp.]
FRLSPIWIATTLCHSLLSSSNKVTYKSPDLSAQDGQASREVTNSSIIGIFSPLINIKMAIQGDQQRAFHEMLMEVHLAKYFIHKNLQDTIKATVQHQGGRCKPVDSGTKAS